MSTVTISKDEYRVLKERAKAFDQIITATDPNLFLVPSIRSRSEIMRQFRSVKKYSPAFLKSIARGLRRSSFFTK